MLQVKEIMKTSALLHPHMGLSEAVKLIVDSGLSGLPVVDEQQQLVGFLSEQDCLQKLIAESYHCDAHVTVAELMRDDPLSVSEQLTTLELGQQMQTNRPKVYPVTRDQKVVGIVTRSQLVHSLSKSLDSCQAY
ncbi:CBS domain-containing protein [Motiliproteus coralliicola]|uniref:CBS domain-containing protein n=1 Tax=Motiliproteus coralliicola TaxID=2283196 RepID=A0A369WPD7_9GAMM|nr:CBS domain-containing protein [Motiliproteus coralliicola]RDE22929.1 CBS domain-containing protein [Motiliproteus coralliicola]